MAITRDNVAMPYAVDITLDLVAAINFRPFAGMIISCPASYAGGDAEVWVSSDVVGDEWTQLADITLAAAAATAVPTAAFAAHRVKIIAPLVPAGTVFIHMKA